MILIYFFHMYMWVFIFLLFELISGIGYLYLLFLQLCPSPTSLVHCYQKWMIEFNYNLSSAFYSNITAWVLVVQPFIKFLVILLESKTLLNNLNLSWYISLFTILGSTQKSITSMNCLQRGFQRSREPALFPLWFRCVLDYILECKSCKNLFAFQ